MQRPDPDVAAHTARMAAEHQRACVPGLSLARLREVEARLAAEIDGDHPDPAIVARHRVVVDELRRRGVGAAG